MELSFYADQFKNVSDVNSDAVKAAKLANAQAIEDYNIRVEEGLTPGNKMPGLTGTLSLMGRTSDISVRNIMELACVLPMWRINLSLPGLISFDEDTMMFQAYLTQDDFVRMRAQKIKIGRYFKRTGMYTDTDVNIMTNKIKSTVHAQKNAKLEFATEPDDIAQVYIDGPHSCMAEKDDFYGLPYHPTYVYGAGDIALAYVKINDRIVARCLTNIEENTYSTPYGNDYLIETLLEEKGYTTGDLDGCRILAIDLDDGGFLMPYIDNASEVGDHDGGYFTIGAWGTPCNNTNGSTQDGYSCDHCGDCCDEDDMIWIEGPSITVCSYSCAEECGYILTGDSDELVDADDCVYCESTGRMHYDLDYLVCVDDNWYTADDEDIVYSEQDDEYYKRDDYTYVDCVDSWILDHEVDTYEEDEDEAA
ncbi:MAG: hypothetical protein GY799_29450 [Desulfobulbaceae bacterium]|nr:hypothetical protein [Desulfobulbaceae bacterium]